MTHNLQVPKAKHNYLQNSSKTSYDLCMITKESTILTKAQSKDVRQRSASIEHQVKLGQTQQTGPLLDTTTQLTTNSRRETSQCKHDENAKTSTNCTQDKHIRARFKLNSYFGVGQKTNCFRELITLGWITGERCVIRQKFQNFV